MCDVLTRCLRCEKVFCSQIEQVVDGRASMGKKGGVKVQRAYKGRKKSTWMKMCFVYHVLYTAPAQKSQLSGTRRSLTKEAAHVVPAAALQSPFRHAFRIFPVSRKKKTPRIVRQAKGREIRQEDAK